MSGTYRNKIIVDKKVCKHTIHMYAPDQYGKY